MNDQPPASQDQLPASGDPRVPTDPAPLNPPVAPDPAASVAPPAPVQQPDAGDPQLGVDATFEPPLELAAAVQAARAAQNSGLKALPRLIGPMGSACPRLAKILRSAAVRASLETYERQDA